MAFSENPVRAKEEREGLVSSLYLRFPPLSRQKVDGLKQFFSYP
jgi:hypothetical protein